MIFKSDKVKAHWDTWAYYHEGTYYLYYLITERSAGEGFGVVTSEDGVHWHDYGWAIRESKRNLVFLGTGAVWKSPDFEKNGRFICNYSEHRTDETGQTTQNILFAWSTDLIHWTEFGEEYIFKVDQRYYHTYGRWDCIFPMPRAEGGYWGTWTASAHPDCDLTGIVGIGYSENGVKWKALPPPVVEPGTGESGAFYQFGDKVFGMFGTSGQPRDGMWTYVADDVRGPYRRAKKNGLLLNLWHTYFSRFLPTPDGVLVNHHSMSGARHYPTAEIMRHICYAAPLKRAVVDSEGTLRFKYWEGNESLKGEPVEICEPSSGNTEWLTDTLDMGVGIVTEATLRLPERSEGSPTRLPIRADAQDYEIRIFHDGSMEMGTVDVDGGNWKRQQEANRDWDFGATADLRLLVRRGMLEAYLDDHFMECHRMDCPEAKQLRLGLPEMRDTTAIQGLQVWKMTLPGWGT